MHSGVRVLAIPAGKLLDQSLPPRLGNVCQRKLPQRQEQCVAGVARIAIGQTVAELFHAVQERIHPGPASAAAEDELRQGFRIIAHLEDRQDLVALAEPQERHRRARARWPYATRSTEPIASGGGVAAIWPSSSIMAGVRLAAMIG